MKRFIVAIFALSVVSIALVFGLRSAIHQADTDFTMACVGKFCEDFVPGQSQVRVDDEVERLKSRLNIEYNRTILIGEFQIVRVLVQPQADDSEEVPQAMTSVERKTPEATEQDFAIESAEKIDISVTADKVSMEPLRAVPISLTGRAPAIWEWRYRATSKDAITFIVSVDELIDDNGIEKRKPLLTKVYSVQPTASAAYVSFSGVWDMLVSVNDGVSSLASILAIATTIAAAAIAILAWARHRSKRKMLVADEGGVETLH